MKQLTQNMKNGRTAIIDIPIPKARPGCALVKIFSSLVSSGTERMLVEFAEKNLVEKARSRPDLVRQVLDKAKREGLIPTIKAAFNKLDQPLTLGYSSAGVIVETGEGLRGFRVGERVACAGGGHAVHAEYNVVPQNLLAKIPDEVDYDSAAFSSLGAIALNGIRLAKLSLGERVAIIGFGLLGMITAELVRASGCHVIGIEINPSRIKRGRSLGFQVTARASAEKACAAFTHNRGVDAVLICADSASNDTVALAGTIARDRAHVISLGVVGIDLPRKPYYEKELFFQVSRSSGPGRYDASYEEKGQDYPIGYVRWTEQRNMQAFLELLSAKKISVDPLISHRFDIQDAPKAYALLTSKNPAHLIGVVLNYPHADLPAAHASIVPSAITGIKNAPGDIILGVLGAGNYAQATFLPIIKNSKVRLRAIASASGVSASHAAKKYAFETIAANDGEIMKDEAINTVLIMTRHSQHASQVITALQNGKNVYCEKPLAINLEQLKQLERSISGERTSLLMVGFNRRFSRFGAQMKRILCDSAVPRVVNYRINAGYLPPSHWLQDPSEGGRLIGEGCHFIDFLNFLIGSTPVSVYGVTVPDNGKYSQDNFSLSFSYRDGSIGTVVYLANGDKSCPKESVEVFCDGLVMRLNDFRSLDLYENSNHRVYRDSLGQDKGHKASWQAFISAVRNQSQPPIPYQDIFSTHYSCLAAKEATAAGKLVLIN